MLRGSSSALYGPNAVNGVINLITKSTDKNTPLVSANLQGGTLNTVIGDVSLRKQFSDKFNAGISYYFETRDRNSEKIYAVADDKYYTLDEYNARNTEELWSLQDAYNEFINVGKSKHKEGINGYIDFTPSNDLSFSLKGGYLDANAITSSIGDNPTPYAQRVSYGYYTNFTAKIYGFNLQSCLNNVLQDFNKNHKGWTQATEQYNVSLDYLLKYNKLSIRPGISYQSVYYDDRDYIDEPGQGYFNDRVALRNYAISARFDYHPTEKLRFVAALRDEKYNKPDKWQPSFQFTGSYKVNDNNLFRAVYSRANQSTFMINAFSNYTWDLSRTAAGESINYVHFAGSENPSMMIQDMYEIGYRTRPKENILIDIETFYNKGKNYSALMPDSIVTTTFVGNPNLIANGEYTSTTLYTSYRDQDLKSKQYGISFSADMVLSEKLMMKTHFTFQKSRVTDFCDLSRDSIATLQAGHYLGTVTSDVTNYLTYVQTNGAYGSAIPPQASYSSDYQPDESYYNDMDNEAVPSFWASLAFSYKLSEKLSLMAQGYYYDKYYTYTQYETSSDRLAKDNQNYTGHINGKFTLNAKVNYKISDKVNVYLNARNLLNNETQEYIFMDKIGGLYLAGFNINL